MKHFITFLAAALLSCNLYAQETVKWASEVMYVTSETSALQYSAGQALRSPNVYPKGGENPNAWRPAKPDNDEYIVVKFDTPIRAQQIAIAETENPGAVSKVFAYDSLDNEYLLFDLNPRPIPLQSRLLNLFFEKTPYRIAYIRVDIKGGSVPGFNSIDAIGLSSSNIPISVLINLAQNVNQELVTERLGENVNSQYLEQSPVLSPDGKTLYFSRRSHPDNVGGVDDYEDIWYSELDEETQEWLPAKNLGAPLNTPGPNFICSITQVGDETVLLLGNRYEKKGRMSQGISMSKSKGDGKWDKPTNINVDNDYNYSDKVDYYMSADTKVILMAVERDDTYGDRDIYASFVKPNGDYSEPKNLGSVVNSADVESAPFLHHDGETLYFSSKGFRGYGNADIYVSKRLDDTWTNWSQPENLGKGVNGSEDDTYFNIPSSGSHAYFSRGKSDENTDIFRFRIDELFVEPTDEPVADSEEIFVTIHGKVLDSKTNEPIMSNVLVERLPDGITVGNAETNEYGEFVFKVRPGATYGVLAEKDGYLSQNENVDLNEVAETTDIQKDLFLSPIEKGAAITLNNIFFEFDKSDLRTSSYAELDRILKLLKSNQINKIEISGHTDSVGDDNYNLDLSQRRAWSVYSYFISNGINASRLESVGYGETIPIGPNDTPENRRTNRRVEFKIID
ncbi:OmpA family protein [Reichenbachiella carrageenanivorans]|uniref:OmpA family protein n=1 Tax=Reichenbachiella carrageenanivorans TaxID=2979869 RepID=A0ABY6D4A3_9BACT|nr:OmpA family protein [Reichenbachiella carrageenanivorans]UXX80629.1 OmpA family protein [Reichenbachiella carrageenanivorans]